MQKKVYLVDSHLSIACIFTFWLLISKFQTLLFVLFLLRTWASCLTRKKIDKLCLSNTPILHLSFVYHYTFMMVLKNYRHFGSGKT